MLIKAYSCALMGIGAIRISIEVHITQGIRFFIVGLADHAIRESQQRIEAALSNNGFDWPRYRVVINLAPADLRKEGTHYDLPLAVGILAASGQVSDRLRRAPDLDSLMQTAVGELSRILGPDRAFVRLGSEAELGAAANGGPGNGGAPESDPETETNVDTDSAEPPVQANGRESDVE